MHSGKVWPEKGWERRVPLLLTSMVMTLGASMSITERSPGPLLDNGVPRPLEAASVRGLVFDDPRPTGSYVALSNASGVLVAGPASAAATAHAISGKS